MWWLISADIMHGKKIHVHILAAGRLVSKILVLNIEWGRYIIYIFYWHSTGLLDNLFGFTCTFHFGAHGDR